MKVVYVAGPFTAPTPWETEQNVRAAETVGLQIVTLGASPLIPHANTRYFVGTASAAFWYEATAALTSMADAVMMVPGWQRSRGARDEKALAESRGIPVFESIEDLNAWIDATQDQPPARSPAAPAGTAGATQGPEGTEQAATSVTREGPAPAPDVIPDGYRLVPGWRLAPPQTFFCGPCPGPRAWAVFASKDFVCCVACAPSMRALEFIEEDSESILGERTGAASLGTNDPREGAVPGNASGATDQKPAGRSTDTGASVSRDARPAAGGAVSYGPGRCDVCGWGLADAMEKGCVPGNCSYRPGDPDEQRRLAERRRQIAHGGAAVAAPQAEVPCTICNQRPCHWSCAKQTVPAPLNPAPEAQPVPTGYRLADGWGDATGGCVCTVAHAGGDTCSRPARYVNRGIGVCYLDAFVGGALVPVEPTAAPECYEDGEQKQSPHQPERLIRATPVVTAGRPRIHSPAEWMRLHGSAPCDCKSFEEVAEPKPTAAPEGQQGEEKAHVAGSNSVNLFTGLPTAPAKASEATITRMSRQLVGATQEIVTMHDRIAALEAELAEAKGRAARAEVREEVADDSADAARAEVEQLRAKLAETVAEMSDDHLKDIEFMGNEADTREAAMRAAAAKVAWDEWSRCGSAAVREVAQVIERLPLSTGEAKLDAIKAAVTAANNRAADAFIAWCARSFSEPNDNPWKELAADGTGRWGREAFAKWLRSGAQAPGTVGGGK